MRRDAVTVRAPAKVNLYLHVTGRRADGYHLLDSLAVFVDDIADIISIEPAERFTFTAAGPFADAVPADEAANLVTRAARAFAGATGFSADLCRIHLVKNLPSGAGIGGGSSDAAQTIHALEKFSGLEVDERVRAALLLRLGADVPICYRARPCRFEGIGDIISDVPALPRLHILLLWPNIHSSTAQVFGARDPASASNRTEWPATFGGSEDFLGFLRDTKNDLSSAAESLHPEIKTARIFLERQKDCLLARMSGSGSTIFGLFKSADACAASCTEAQREGWWAKTGTI